MKILKILAVALPSLIMMPASATTVSYDFANLQLSGNDNVGLLPDETLNSGYWQCTGGDICSSNLAAQKNPFDGDLKYTVGGITTTATGYYFKDGIWNQVAAVQDHEDGYNALKHIGAGLGVYHAKDSSDDNVTVNEKLILKFATAVKLSALSLRSDGHNTSWGAGSTFLLDGVSTMLAGDINGLDKVGKEFTFSFGGNHPDQFYLGGMTVSTVPEPSNYALMFAGLGAMCLIGNRRKQRSK